MNLFQVYSLFPVEPVRGKGCYVYDKNGTEYMDFYGGHAVISIGHSHPQYVKMLKGQIDKIGFYSNSVENSLQIELAEKLGAAMGSNTYELFLCNSGAEANENAIKMASFAKPEATEFITLKNSFHGRTSAAVNLTDNNKIQSPVNKSIKTHIYDYQDNDGITSALSSNNICAVIIEPIQGVGGLDSPSIECIKKISQACNDTNTSFILDEIQSGYGRSGKFFAHQFADIQPDIITTAKGMGNGFPIAGVLLNKNKYKPWPGMLGTTFGGNHLACAAGIAVLDVIKEENLVHNAATIGRYLHDQLSGHKDIKSIKGKGLMMGIELPYPIAELRKQLLFDQKLFTGSAKNKNLLRILPPLNITNKEADIFLEKLKSGLRQYQNNK